MYILTLRDHTFLIRKRINLNCPNTRSVTTINGKISEVCNITNNAFAKYVYSSLEDTFALLFTLIYCLSMSAWFISETTTRILVTIVCVGPV